MTPDSPEAFRDTVRRVGQLERDMSGIQQHVSSLGHEVELLAPVQLSVVRIEGQVCQVKEQLVSLRESLINDRNAAKERGVQYATEMRELREELAEDQASGRKQLIVAAVSIITTFLIVGGTILAAILGNA